MPTYIFRDKKSGELIEEFMTFSEREIFMELHPDLEPEPTAPAIVSGVDSSRLKPDKPFRELLTKIGKNSGKKVNDWGG